MAITAEAYSILGHRKSQQDFAGLLSNPHRVLGVLCDGMGGLQGGERASMTAVTMVLEDCEKEETGTDCADFLCREAVRIDEAVYRMTTPEGKSLGAGTTVVAAQVDEDGLVWWISVGDSRIYLYRGGELTQLTRDHNYRNFLEDSLEKGEITRDYFDREIQGRMAEALTSYIGRGQVEQIDRNLQPLRLQEGDQLLLCSDGLYKSLNQRQIEAMLTDNQIDVRVSAKRLVNMALAKAVKKQDNTTVILIQYHGRKTEE